MRTVALLSIVILALAAGADEAPIITSSQSATATTGQFFSYTIVASGTTPITYSAMPLPQGMTQFDEVISGTPGLAGTYFINLSATNPTGSDTRTLVLTVTDPQIAPSITSRLQAAGTVGQPFTYTITATGTQPINFSALPLPPGLSLNGAQITGIPTQGGFTTVNLGASNTAGTDNEALFVTINVPRELDTAPSITSPLNAVATAGAAFHYTVTATGTPPVVFTVEGLPKGLKFNGSAISGKAEDAGTFNLQFTASNAVGNARATLVLIVNPPGGADISGTWTGKARDAKYDFAGTNGKGAATTEMLHADFTHSGDSLTATMTFSGNGSARTFTLNGQIGNSSFWLSGANEDATRTLVISGHVTKKGNVINATGINYGAGSSDEIKISLKK